jgi:recombinational DNA repair ATPase RecF
MNMARRLALAVLLALGLFLAATPAWSGSYLNRAALLLEQARAERDMVWPRATDKELVRVAHRVAQARAAAARDMEVPKVVASAHPHLLLALANTESAYAAALAGEYERFAEQIVRARAEDKTFRALIRKMGYTLPNRSAWRK